ncbi:signal recognition particle 14kD protein-domain-containing protein [Rhypophila decipiens]|uniref:Signal recognition particle subunit SRP14 n=1 Tax=Rhypophila decipiens TaxID=261697 RepID=A0AAN7BA23_9PEZI|nr:signal recognition particle 14kD protein-domain-containing protein [Rhypophila decipiens]
MTPLTHEEFFAKLGELILSGKNDPLFEIFLTQKRYTYGSELPKPSEENPFPETSLEKPLPILIHATDGLFKEERPQRTKLSTLVQPDQLDGFYSRYAEVCKGSMAALKPRDRRTKKAKARKKKGGAGQTSMTAIP